MFVSRQLPQKNWVVDYLCARLRFGGLLPQASQVLGKSKLGNFEWGFLLWRQASRASFPEPLP
jgi:hypothetical protein